MVDAWLILGMLGILFQPCLNELLICYGYESGLLQSALIKPKVLDALAVK